MPDCKINAKICIDKCTSTYSNVNHFEISKKIILKTNLLLLIFIDVYVIFHKSDSDRSNSR